MTYNPNQLSKEERLAFQLKGDKKKKIVRVIRKRRSSNLQAHEQPLLYIQVHKKGRKK